MLKPYPENCTELSNDAGHELAEAYLAAGPASRPRFTDKMPSNFQFLGIIKLLFPHARVIHCVRHPLDVAVSTYFQCFTTPVAYANSLDTIAHFYREYCRLMRHWDRVLGDWYMTVKYEDLISNQALWTRRLLAFCRLDWSDACLRFFEVQREVRTTNWSIRQPIYHTARDRWKNYRAQLESILDLAKEAI